MKETIKVCEKNENGTLSIIDEKKMTVTLNETEMALYAKYNRKNYKVEGNYMFSFIVVNND